MGSPRKCSASHHTLRFYIVVFSVGWESIPLGYNCRLELGLAAVLKPGSGSLVQWLAAAVDQRWCLREAVLCVL
jgi:hypothetical protein